MNSMTTLEELAAAKHPYYCSESNYYSNEGSMEFDTMSAFLDEFDDADLDLNLCFRWDMQKERGRYSAMVFLMLQRKGIFRPCTIKSVTEDEAVLFKAYAEKHWAHLQKIWKPISL